MIKERLSKLQKWILSQCLKGETINRDDVKGFYDKKYPPSYKDKELLWLDADRAEKHMLEERKIEKRKFDI